MIDFINLTLLQTGSSDVIRQFVTWAVGYRIAAYFPLIKDIIMLIGDIVGLVGSLRIYIRWANGDQNVGKKIVGWGGACLFLIIVPIFLGLLFNL